MAAVSVIIPVYNVEAYIDRCMESVTGQTCRDIEIILINDGSTDGSGDKCLEWAKRDNRIIYVSKKNEGAGPSRNLGIQMASAELVAFCDPDDWYDLRYVELMLEKQRETGADIVVCGYYKYDGISDSILSMHNPEYKESKHVSWRWNLRHSVCIKLFRKALFLEHDIKLPACYGEDTAIYCFIMTKAKKVVLL